MNQLCMKYSTVDSKTSFFTYVSLFSGAGIGCYGFKSNGFECIASNEVLEKRLNIQKYNNKCRYDSGYVIGDLSNTDVKIPSMIKSNYGKIKTMFMKWM